MILLISENEGFLTKLKISYMVINTFLYLTYGTELRSPPPCAVIVHFSIEKKGGNKNFLLPSCTSYPLICKYLVRLSNEGSSSSLTCKVWSRVRYPSPAPYFSKTYSLMIRLITPICVSFVLSASNYSTLNTPSRFSVTEISL
jgi:hypothetical protein